MERLLKDAAIDARSRAEVEGRLRAFNARVYGWLSGQDGDTTAEEDARQELDAVSDDEMFALIDEEFGPTSS